MILQCTPPNTMEPNRDASPHEKDHILFWVVIYRTQFFFSEGTFYKRWVLTQGES
jgi:hypothetical protein